MDAATRSIKRFGSDKRSKNSDFVRLSSLPVESIISTSSETSTFTPTSGCCIQLGARATWIFLKRCTSALNNHAVWGQQHDCAFCLCFKCVNFLSRFPSGVVFQIICVLISKITQRGDYENQCYWVATLIDYILIYPWISEQMYMLLHWNFSWFLRIQEYQKVINESGHPIALDAMVTTL